MATRKTRASQATRTAWSNGRFLMAAGTGRAVGRGVFGRTRSRAAVLTVALAGGLTIGGCPPLPESVDVLFGTSFAEPIVASVSPDTGPEAGGTKVTVRGYGFEPGTGVVFGGNVAAGVTRVNDNLLEAISPPGSAGMVDVVVVAGDGQTAVATAAFEYFAPPPTAAAPAPESIAGVAPATGPTAGGTRVTVRGSGFADGIGVLFGGQLAASVTVVNGGLLEVTTPAAAAGTVDVAIVLGDGRIATLPAAFQYFAPQAPEAKLRVTAVEPTRVPTLGGNRITIFGEGFAPGTTVMFGAFMGAETEVVSESELRVTAPAQAAGMTEVVVVGPDGQSDTAGVGLEYVAIGDADAEIIRLLEERFAGGPRIVSAVATSHTSVRLTLSEPITAADATDPGNYAIVIPGGGVLLLDPGAAPALSADQTVVRLTTLGQADADYLLTVTGLRDLAGNRQASPDILVNPTETRFQGIAPASIDEQKDSDGDGFADWFEMLGWPIQIELANGARADGYVTSDPFNPDTDGDGLLDSEENARSLDPRTDDTDADLVSDFIETRHLLSDPADQDSDDDGFADSTELQFKTSVTLADTDGDQLDDRDEVVLRNRNPRRADLPLPQILIGTMNVEIDERFTYTDERGVEQSTERTSAVAFTQSDSTSYSTSSTRSNESTNEFSQQIKAGGEGEIGKGKAGIKLGAEVQVGFGQARGQGYSSTVSQESSRTAQEEYSRSLSEALAISERNSVTRSVEAARLSVDVTIANAGDLAFTISNLEVSSRIQDPRDRTRFLPMATLLPSSGNNSINIGPLAAQRGPFIFENTEIFPNLAQSLLREPRATVFEIANFDIEDELGRNFAFTSEEINDLTAAITFDFGNGEVETHRVATSSTFSNGVTDGITMREALVEILGFREEPNEPALPDGFDPDDPVIRNSYGTGVGPDGEQILTRVRGVQTEFDLTSPEARFWVVLSTADIPAARDFGDLVLKPGDTYLIWYVQDADDDGLYAREEFLAGSSDRALDTDGDGISDFDEVKVGWETATPGDRRRVYSSPAAADTDGDQVDDNLERRLGSDPRLRDSDADGLDDLTEVDGYTVTLLDSDNDPSNDTIISVRPYSDAVILEPRTDGDGVATTLADPNSDDVQIIAVGAAVLPGDAIVGPGADGILDSAPDGDELATVSGPTIAATQAGPARSTADPNSDDVQEVDAGVDVLPGTVVVSPGRDGVLQTAPGGSEVVREPHRAMFASDPVQGDSDADSLRDGREQFLGSRPNVQDAASVIDSDLDGLTDQVEMDGWSVGGSGPLVTSDPTKPDTDGDGLPDTYEWALFSNPRAPDTDGDGLSDIREFDPLNARDFYVTERLDNAELRCADALDCVFQPAPTPTGTNLLDADTDDDLLHDGAEVNGWDVRVVGEPIETVTSNPFLQNSDTDGLSDWDEYRGGDGRVPSDPLDDGDATNPGVADSDGDGVSDSVERSQNGRALLGPERRNPLRRDQLLEIRMTEYHVLVTNDAGDDAEQRFEFFITPPGAGESKIVSSIDNPGALGMVDCDVDSTTPCYQQDVQGCSGNTIEIDDGDRVFVPAAFARLVVVAENQQVRIRGWFTEVDGGCEDSDEGFPLNEEVILDGIQQGPPTSAEFGLTNADVDVRLKYRYSAVNN